MSKRIRAVFSLTVSTMGLGLGLLAQPGIAQEAAPQAQDAEYGKLIDQYLVDKRFSTELVDHLPASSTVPSPLKYFGNGKIPGKPGELYYPEEIENYYKELAKTSPRVKFWVVGKSEEGRDIVVIAIADEQTLKNLDAEKAGLAALGDPRKTSEEQARKLIKTTKPLYWITSGIHSPETGGPQMLVELAYRLAVEETPFIQNIRNNMVTFITPVLEVDGRAKMVDTYYYGKKTGNPRPPMMYWGKYVAHDNNRDGVGQYLHLTQALTEGTLEWHPTVLHDLHEAQSYLYVSTGTGPYNDKLLPVQSQEWQLLAQTEVSEMAKRKVPGVFTWGFYDGWVPNYLFWIANVHNSFGRFYEVQSYGPDVQKGLKLAPSVTSKEWYRPNPPLPVIDWGPRNNTNIQESALLFAMNKVATDRETYLETYWVKNRQAIEAGQEAGNVNAWVIPAKQRAQLNVIDMINDLRHQGLEISTANSAFTVGGVSVQPGDYIIRGDQPYHTLADIYLSVQNYPAANPKPYDDTGWTMQYLHNVTLKYVKDVNVLKQPMTPLTADIAPKGVISGSGPVILVNHTGDNELVSFRFRLAKTKMLAAEAPFELGGKHYAAGTFIIPAANRAEVEKVVADLGLVGEAVGAAPSVPSHELTIPRIGYLHSWQRTQDEGWWRAALDHFGVPYTYFADIKVREGGLRQKYDVIIYPTVGGSAKDVLTGVAMNGNVPIPYKKSALTPNLGAQDSAEDIRGGLGADGLAELKKFVQAGGTLIGDGSTTDTLATYGTAPGIDVTEPSELYTKGAIMRGVFKDQTSPITYGYEQKELPVYFSAAPVLSISGGGGRGMGSYFDPNAPGNRLAQNVTPNDRMGHLSAWDPSQPVMDTTPPPTMDPSPFGAQAPTSRTGGAEATQHPRLIMSFPAKSDDILLSGLLSGGQALQNKALVVDVPDGKGHYVLYAMRPFWRWTSQGSYNLGFNAIMNWNHLDAGGK